MNSNHWKHMFSNFDAAQEELKAQRAQGGTDVYGCHGVILEVLL